MKNSSSLSANEYSVNIENIKLNLFTNSSVEMIYVNNYSPQLHFHLYYEVFFIKSGKLKIAFENETVELGENDLFIISPNVPHCTLSAEQSDRKGELLYFSIEKNSLKTNLNLFGKISKIFDSKYVRFNKETGFAYIIHKIVESVSGKNPYYTGVYLYEFFLDILQQQKDVSVLNTDATLSHDSNMTRMNKIDMILSNNFKNEVTLDELAEVLFLSKRQTSRIIKKHYGVNLRQLIVQMKMKKAGELLVQSDKPISVIASELGYDSLKGFYYIFKKYYGILPAQYRKQYKNSLTL